MYKHAETLKEIHSRFIYQKPEPAMVPKFEAVREQLQDIAMVLCEMVPECSELSTAINKLEEAMFWANAGIARKHEAAPPSVIDLVEPPQKV